MRGQERILRERLARVACETCGADHQPDDMLVLAQRGSRWLVLLTCRQCAHRCIFVASFPHTASPSLSIDPLEQLDSLDSAPSSTNSYTPFTVPEQNYPDVFSSDTGGSRADSLVTLDDVDGVKHFLEGFNGDFRTLFGPRER